MKSKYKVIIIGAGPSGISTALNLKEMGIDDILIIEKYKFPRYKCCAGYITSKTKKEYERLGIDFKDCNYTLINDFNIFYKLKLRQNIVNKFLYTNKKIDRVELDYTFYKKAVSKGIKIAQKVTIKEHDIDNNNVILTNGKKINYDYLVFADGTNGYGSRYQKSKKKNIAMQMIFKSDKKEEIQIHFGITKKGYAWSSTFNGLTNVGITDVFNQNINYEELFKTFLKSLEFKGDTKELKGAFTPIGVRKPIINENIYFVGDAVGACDPLTLSGLKYGLASGKYCARAIKEKNNRIYHKYINKLKIKFVFMAYLLKIFYLKITLFCIFEIGCRFFRRIIEYVFNNFFINKK